MTDRFRVVPAAYVIFRREHDGRSQVLLQLRQGTGYMDGFWATAAAGHVEADESVLEAACREAAEELGVTVHEDDLVALCGMHRTGGNHDPIDERVDFFFQVEPLARRPAAGRGGQGGRAALVRLWTRCRTRSCRTSSSCSTTSGTGCPRSSPSASEPRRTIPAVTNPTGLADLETLEEIERRVLWLAVAHRRRRQPRAGDRRRREGRRPPGVQRVAGVGDDRAVVRPPRGRRPGGGQAARLAGAARDPTTCSATSTASYLTTLRARGGLQSYPSRTKDPDRVDFSTGSVGLGAAAPLFAARHPPLRRRALRPARRAAGSSRCSATPSSTRATSGRRSPTPRPRASATCCGSSTSTGSRWTGWCPACGSTSGRSSSPRPAGTSSR